ncbi:MAG: heavy-metal-associated domain-containing protein [Bacteriovorax sp.]|jgi:mercuric ion binding protein
MKNYFVIFWVLFSFASSADDQIEVTVKGMVCSFCSQGITKKFKERPEVKTVKVSLENHLVSIELKDGQKMEDKLIETTLTDAGYSIEKITRK